MANFSPITDAELVRARQDPAFRHKLLAESLDILLAELKKARKSPPADVKAEQIREGVALAVRLAEMIQTSARPSGHS